MATLSNRQKIAAFNKENCAKQPRSNLAQNTNVPRSQDDYITQVSEEIEDRVTKKLSQEFSRRENCIIGALSRLDDFLLNPYFKTTPELLRQRSGTHYVQARERMRTTSRVILILKRVSVRIRLHETLAQMTLTTIRSLVLEFCPNVIVSTIQTFVFGCFQETT